jgi:hypothetical protein
MWICQVFPPDRVEIRLLASKLGDDFIVEKRGANLLDSIKPDQRLLTYDAFHLTATTPTLATSFLRRHFASGVTVDSTAVYFPFFGKDDNADIVFAVHGYPKQDARKLSFDEKEQYIEVEL